jgi:hypothetical protein
MIVDLDPTARPTDVSLTSVSGEIAIRLPHPADAEVEANTASGAVSNAFEDLRVSGQWGAKRITGRLGTGNGRLKATTVSGSIALLRRPQEEEQGDDAWEAEPEPPHDDDRDSPAGRRATPGVDSSTSADRPAASASSPADEADPADGAQAGSGDNSGSGPGGDATATDAPADSTTDKKVL